MEIDPIAEGLEWFSMMAAVVMFVWAVVTNLALAIVALGCAGVAVVVGGYIISGITDANRS